MPSVRYLSGNRILTRQYRQENLLIGVCNSLDQKVIRDTWEIDKVIAT